VHLRDRTRHGDRRPPSDTPDAARSREKLAMKRKDQRNLTERGSIDAQPDPDTISPRPYCSSRRSREQSSSPSGKRSPPRRPRAADRSSARALVGKRSTSPAVEHVAETLARAEAVIEAAAAQRLFADAMALEARAIGLVERAGGRGRPARRGCRFAGDVHATTESGTEGSVKQPRRPHTASSGLACDGV
jgi:hypothetical protein